MGLKIKSGTSWPTISGQLIATVPTPTYSGQCSNTNAALSINPYTGQGPGANGIGLTCDEIRDLALGVVNLTNGTFTADNATTEPNQTNVNVESGDITLLGLS